MKIKRLFFLFCICLLAICGCKSRASIDVPRPDRGYLHTLEQQAMIGVANRLINSVSQSDLIWRYSGAGGQCDILLKAAPNWLDINAYALALAPPIFPKLERDLPLLTGDYIQGLYLGPIDEDLDFLQTNQGSKNNFGKTAASLSFAEIFGGEEAWQKLLQKAEDSGIQLGADILPAFTGRGPDFILQARKAPATQGLYAMVEVPREFWKDLPEADAEWDCKALKSQQVSTLAQAGLIPENIVRDSLNWPAFSGWACTGEVDDTAGQPRRWLYRYFETPEQPVFFWQDPTGRARRVLAAAIIRQTGLLGQALVGLHMEALIGLEPDDFQNAQKSVGQTGAIDPGLQALTELAGQIHRYGGWALQADAISPSYIEETLKTPCDFCRDDATLLALVSGLKEESPQPLFQLYDKWLKNKLDFKRLARAYNQWRPLNTRLLAEEKSSGKKNNYDTNGSSSRTRMTLQDVQASFEPKLREKFHNIWQSVHIGLPGLIFLAPEDLGQDIGGQNINRGSQTLLNQNDKIKKILDLRAKMDLANGNLISVHKSGNSKAMGFLTALPDGNFWFCAINFSPASASFSLAALPKKFMKAVIVETGETIQALNSQQSAQDIQLGGYAAQNIIFFKG